MMLVPLHLLSHRMKTLCGKQSRLVATVGVGGDTLGWSDGSGRQVEEPLLLPGTRSHPRHPVASFKQNKTKHPQLGCGGRLSAQKHASISLMNRRQINSSANRFQEHFGHLLTKIKGGISEICLEAILSLDAEQ